MVLYLCTVSTQYWNLSKKISQATANVTVKISGSKWSFTNPLRVQIPRELGVATELRHRVHTACAEFRMVFVLANRFFPAPATGALSPFGLGDRIGGGHSACVFDEF